MSLLDKPTAPEEQLTVPDLEPKREPLMTRKQVEAQQRKERAAQQKIRRAELHKKWTKERKEIDEHSDDPQWLETYVKKARKNDEHHDMRTGQMVVMLNPYELALLKRALLPSKGNEAGYKSIRELLVSLAEKSLNVK